MRGLVLLVLTIVACRAAAPVVLVGDDAGVVVLAHELIGSEPVPASLCQRASRISQWRELRRSFGGEVAQLSASYAAFAVEQVVAVALPPGAWVRRIVVGTEEGVDVLTLACDATGSQQPVACLLLLARRPNQLAVVLRLDGGGERTVGVFDGL